MTAFNGGIMREAVHCKVDGDKKRRHLAFPPFYCQGMPVRARDQSFCGRNIRSWRCRNIVGSKLLDSVSDWDTLADCPACRDWVREHT